MGEPAEWKSRKTVIEQISAKQNQTEIMNEATKKYSKEFSALTAADCNNKQVAGRWSVDWIWSVLAKENLLLFA